MTGLRVLSAARKLSSFLLSAQCVPGGCFLGGGGKKKCGDVTYQGKHALVV